MFENLRNLLSDYYFLYLKTQNYHWNFEGKDFFVWHPEFGRQYEDLAKVIDTTAELIRGLGHKAPANFDTYIRYTSLIPGNEEYNSEEMLEDITHDHRRLLITLQNVLQTAQNIGDEVIIDFVIGQMTYHRKVLWMLKSSQK